MIFLVRPPSATQYLCSQNRPEYPPKLWSTSQGKGISDTTAQRDQCPTRHRTPKIHVITGSLTLPSPYHHSRSRKTPCKFPPAAQRPLTPTPQRQCLRSRKRSISVGLKKPTSPKAQTGFLVTVSHSPTWIGLGPEGKFRKFDRLCPNERIAVAGWRVRRKFTIQASPKNLHESNRGKQRLSFPPRLNACAAARTFLSSPRFSSAHGCHAVGPARKDPEEVARWGLCTRALARHCTAGGSYRRDGSPQLRKAALSSFIT
jgi:hypothetical protein